MEEKKWCTQFSILFVTYLIAILHCAAPHPCSYNRHRENIGITLQFNCKGKKSVCMCLHKIFVIHFVFIPKFTSHHPDIGWRIYTMLINYKMMTSTTSLLLSTSFSLSFFPSNLEFFFWTRDNFNNGISNHIIVYLFCNFNMRHKKYYCNDLYIELYWKLPLMMVIARVYINIRMHLFAIYFNLYFSYNFIFRYFVLWFEW